MSSKRVEYLAKVESMSLDGRKISVLLKILDNCVNQKISLPIRKAKNEGIFPGNKYLIEVEVISSGDPSCSTMHYSPIAIKRTDGSLIYQI